MYNTTSSEMVANLTELLDLSDQQNRSYTISTGRRRISAETLYLIIPYGFIFFLAVAGNALVIITLAVNKKMRTVTNIFLLNLAVGDLLLGVLCMPFTLTGVILRQFVFGSALCKIIPYFQAVSVSVSAWTLVSMSVERYFAICHPLKSRKWQTRSHAYKMIASVWAGSCICMLPILVLSKLQKFTRTGKYKCREYWPNPISEKLFTLFLDLTLLLIPLVVMSITYSLIIRTLWKAMGTPKDEEDSEGFEEDQESVNTPGESRKSYSDGFRRAKQLTFHSAASSKAHSTKQTRGMRFRKSNAERSTRQKKRVIKMLFVVVLEFFICWTPLYVINTVALFSPKSVYRVLGYKGISFFQLLAYTSSCCNPVTYCFMNEKFRDSFRKIFCCKRRRIAANAAN